MSELERPPLDQRVFEQIEIMQHVVDQQHWPIIAGFQVDATKKRNPPLQVPKTPMNLLGALQAYASMLFKREADQYWQFRQDPNYAPWLGFVEQRVIARVFRTIAAIEETSKPATLGYHGLTDDEIMEGLGKILFEVRNSYLWTVPASEPPRVPNLAIDASRVPRAPELPSSTKSVPPQQRPLGSPGARLPSSVHCPSAARKMEAYINSKGLNQTEFAIQANTTDKTIRKFRQTGKIRRSLLPGIAKAMGISKDELLQ